ncbi:MAG: EAL domain-containing protein [Woeseiaceae bacterium]
MAIKNSPKADGQLEIFAHQLLSGLGDAEAVAVQDASGGLLAIAPIDVSSADWLPLSAVSHVQEYTRMSVPGLRVKLCFEVPLCQRPVKTPLGRLIVLFKDDEPARHIKALSRQQTLIDCVYRQLEVRKELRDARSASLQSNADLDFLTRCDSIVTSMKAKAALPSLIAATAAHLDCSLIAMLVPDQKLIEVWPQDQLSIEESHVRTLRSLGQLFATVRKARQVIISSDNTLAESLQSSVGCGKFIIASPVSDQDGDVQGIFVVVRNEQASRDHVRLSRALCVKMESLLFRQSKSTSRPKGRRSLIQRMDDDITRNPDVERAMMVVDIDRLHTINDRHGHELGDKTITAVHELLDAMVPSHDLVVSLSGDLLGVYLSQATEREAVTVAESILQKVTELSVPGLGEETLLSVSIGVALMPAFAKSGSEAVSVAEVASRSAKSRGTGQMVIFRDLDASIMQRHQDLSEIGNLQSALIENRFVLYAQPIREVGVDGSFRKYEILVRMRDRDGRLIPPNHFLSAAERYQIMPSVDRWVVTHALKELAHAENPLEVNLCRFAINISGQSLTDPDFVKFLLKSIRDSGLSPDSLCFEITESAAVRRIDAAIEFILAVRRIGCSVAIDDFGTGHCSFAYLHEMPVDFIKIDGMFVKNILESELSVAIVKGVIGIARVMGVSTVAEFVEHSAIEERVAELGVTHAQGYGVGRPLPLSNILGDMETPFELGLTSTIRVANFASMDETRSLA